MNYLREHRLMVGLTQDELAKRVRLSQPAISMIERGEMRATLEVARALADALDCTVDDLFPAQASSVA